VLYVNVVSASGTQWTGVFLAEAGGENGSRVTLAENAIVIAEPKQGKLELHLKGGSTQTNSIALTPTITRSPPLGKATSPSRSAGWCPRSGGNSAIRNGPLRELARDKSAGWREARVEMYRRFAFPMACLAFALIAVPLGAQRAAAGAPQAR